MTYIFLETGKPATSEAVFIKTLIENLGYNISSNKVEFVNGYKNLINVIPTIKARKTEKSLSYLMQTLSGTMGDTRQGRRK